MIRCRERKRGGMVWKPLLKGSIAVEAIESACAIADALEDGTIEIPISSYAQGTAGIALLHSYISIICGDQRAAERAKQRLSQAIEDASEQEPLPGFFVGLPGIAWTSQHLQELLVGKVELDLNQEVDEWLSEIVQTSPWPGRLDVIYGLIGIGCYALDHPDRRLAAWVLEQIVERLEELAVIRPTGIAWRVSPELAPALMTKLYPEGYFDMGLAHGMAGIVALLARICRAGFASPQARFLLNGAVSWLLAQRRAGEGSTFPGILTDPTGQDTPADSCRSAWCYGDPGVAVALLSAARALSEPVWEREAVALALRDCARSLPETGVVDAELCHGAAGLGHLYNRLYSVTGQEAFGQGARQWFERTLAMRQPGRGIAGFSCWWPEAGRWHSDPGLLTGAAGIALALLSAASDLEPSWDYPMLLDLSKEAAV